MKYLLYYCNPNAFIREFDTLEEAMSILIVLRHIPASIRIDNMKDSSYCIYIVHDSTIVASTAFSGDPKFTVGYSWKDIK